MLEIAKIVNNLKSKKRMIHLITNYVTANDCANVVLACQASPIMADDPKEVSEITALSDALVINIGTLHEHTIPSMLKSGKQANLTGLPVIFDPVGAGSSEFRTETAKKLLENIQFTAIRANISEIKALANIARTTQGVDANQKDVVTPQNLESYVDLICGFSKKTGAIVIASGEMDIISNGGITCVVKNGHPMMSRVTGTGCMLSAVLAAFLAANPSDRFYASIAAVVSFGVCGELAYDDQIGNATYRTHLIDEIDHIQPQIVEEKARYEWIGK